MNPTDRDSGSHLLQSMRRKLAALFGEARVSTVSIETLRPRVTGRDADLSGRAVPVTFGTARGVLTSAHLAGGAVCNPVAIDVTVAADPLTVYNDIPVYSGLLGEITGRGEKLVLDEVAAPAVIAIDMVALGGAVARRLDFPRLGPAVVHASDVALPRKFTKADRRVTGLGLMKPRLRTMPARIVQDIALERRREPMRAAPAGEAPMGFGHEMELLKAASGDPDADIKLVGVYCSVPIAAASRIEFDPPTGSLMLNLRENAAQQIVAAKRPVVILILGQIASTGRMVRAFRP